VRIDIFILLMDEMMNTTTVKELVLAAGADLCGIAPVDRFASAPDGFRPTDLFPDAKSVIVFAKKIPASVFQTQSDIPYSFVDEVALHEVLRLSLDIAVRLEKEHIAALPVPSEPYEYWDKESMTGRGLMSLKHAGYLAGLGVIGRNTLLCTPEYGNLIKLGALLADVELEPDPVLENKLCSDKCNLCTSGCPSGALTNGAVDQKKCRTWSEGATEKGAPIIVCYNCRRVCPNRAGWKTAAV
jgi:epoxyqueuosine reductase